MHKAIYQKYTTTEGKGQRNSLLIKNSINQNWVMGVFFFFSELMRMGLTRLKKLRDHLGMLNTALTRHHIGWQMCYVQGAVLSTVDSRRGSVHVNLIKWYINQIKCYQNDVFLRPKPIRILLRYKIVIFSHSIVYDHTTLNTPVLVRSPKLSNVGPG